MIGDAVARLRLVNHGLLGEGFASPEDAVSRLCAVQAQDFAGATWAVAQRVGAGAAETDVGGAFDAGRILRTHVLRPTWHFVAPADIRWMLALSSPRIKALMAPQDRKLELDDETLAKCMKILAKALRGRRLTRGELGEALGAKGISATGQRLGNIAMRAEIEALVCSGPVRGRQFTYGLLDELVPRTQVIPREVALATLACRYFAHHGPATEADFAWWSGLGRGDARLAIALAGARLVRESIGAGDFWASAAAPSGGTPGGAAKKPAHSKARAVQFLHVYDEFLVGYDGFGRLLKDAGSSTTAHVLLGEGRPIGRWTRTLGASRAELRLSLFAEPTARERASILAAAGSYGRFLGLPLELAFTSPIRARDRSE